MPNHNEIVETICPKLEAKNIFFVARRKLPDGADMVYVSCKSGPANITMLAEIGFRPGTGAASIVVKAAQPQYVPLLPPAIEKILKS